MSYLKIFRYGYWFIETLSNFLRFYIGGLRTYCAYVHVFAWILEHWNDTKHSEIRNLFVIMWLRRQVSGEYFFCKEKLVWFRELFLISSIHCCIFRKHFCFKESQNLVKQAFLGLSAVLWTPNTAILSLFGRKQVPVTS